MELLLMIVLAAFLSELLVFQLIPVKSKSSYFDKKK